MGFIKWLSCICIAILGISILIGGTIVVSIIGVSIGSLLAAGVFVMFIAWLIGESFKKLFTKKL